MEASRLLGRAIVPLNRKFIMIQCFVCLGVVYLKYDVVYTIRSLNESNIRIEFFFYSAFHHTYG